MRRQLLLAVGSLCLLLSTSASAEIYRWTDRSGKVHYTSDINQVPAGQRDLARASSGSTGKGSVQRVAQSSDAPAGARTASPAPMRVGMPASPVADAPAGEPRATSMGGRTQAQWAEEAARYREQIASAEKRVDGCKDAGRGYSRTPFGDTQGKEDACESAENQLDAARARLERLEDSAHRAGVPAGWLLD